MEETLKLIILVAPQLTVDKDKMVVALEAQEVVKKEENPVPFLLEILDSEPLKIMFKASSNHVEILRM
jgi:hypothetical protein